MTVLDRIWGVLAQSAPATQPGQGTGMAPFWATPLFPIMVGLGLFYLFIWRGQSKEKKKKKDMLGAMTKNDRVMTIGGIIGTVVTVKDDEVVVKVDESTNTKMTFTRRAIQKVFSPGEGGDQ